MANFQQAYEKYIKPSEGYYVNDPSDKGGETYAGIARNFNPTWEGWNIIDELKNKYINNIIPRHTKIKEADAYAENFYQNRWGRLKLNDINNQSIANLLFDYHVNSGVLAVHAIQRLVGVQDDGIIGNKTIAAINSADQKKLFELYKNQRRNFFQSLVQKNPSQGKFISGWIARVDKFKFEV